jgi:hypothetical protein
MKAGKEEKDWRFGNHSCAEGKKVKVLTHRSRYIEPVVVPEFGEGTSSAAEAKQAASIV